MSLVPYLIAWRTIPLQDREVVDALVDPAHAGPSVPLAALLREWPGTYYWSDEPDGRHLVLTRPSQPRSREAWLLHLFLFLATLATTTATGAMLAGFPTPVFPTTVNSGFFALLSAGLPFSLPLLAILLSHELGHYVAARRYQLDVSPPHFLPGLLWPFGIGTFGAFIRLRTILTDRRQLIDVGAAGPFAGFLVALPVLWIGLTLSHPLDGGSLRGLIVTAAGDAFPVGDSVVTLALARLIFGDAPAAILHPTAVAGWFGMFVTMLNLLPMAQLDGGHIVFAAAPHWHQRVAAGFWVLIMVLGTQWFGWFVWGLIVLMLSRGRLVHPPVLDAYRPLPNSRRWIGWASLVLFLLTFSPVPFRG